MQALEAALAAFPGAQERPGQRAMVEAVARSLSNGEHLLVQAGTGTGKSLGYLVPALVSGKRVVVATATKALQAQLVDKDLPRLAAALTPVLGRTPTYALAKGRGNYACLQQVNGGPGAREDEPSDSLFDGPASSLGTQVVRLREWVGETETGDRDEVPFPVTDRAWRQVSVSARECLGSRCPDRVECFAERAREAAKEADVVVANHALLALDAFTEVSVLPEHDAVVVDEAHELAESVTDALSHELSAGDVRRAVASAGELVSEATTARLESARDGVEGVLQLLQPGWVRSLDRHSLDVLALLDAAASAAAGELRPRHGRRRPRGGPQGARPHDADLGRRGGPGDRHAVGQLGGARHRGRPAAGVAAAGRWRAGQPAARREDRDRHVGDAHPRRLVPARRAGSSAWCGWPARRSGTARRTTCATPRPSSRCWRRTTRRRGGGTSTWAAPSTTRGRPSCGSPARCPTPAGCRVSWAAGGRRAARRAGAGRRRSHARALQQHRRRRPRRRSGARGDRPAGAAAGRRHRRRAGAPVRLRRPHLPVRDALVLAGRRRARQRLPARRRRPDPVRARGRPAVQGAARRRRRRRPQRLPRGHAAARGGPARAGRRPAAALHRGPRRRRGARPAARDRAATRASCSTRCRRSSARGPRSRCWPRCGRSTRRRRRSCRPGRRRAERRRVVART